MSTTVPVVERVLSANDAVAGEVRALLDARGIYCVNLMASPGAGKTSLIERTVAALKDEFGIGMINGDTSAAAFDAERSLRAGAVAVHVNTQGKCHLEAAMVRDALALLPLDRIRLLLVENVGNLVCPMSWKLGAHANVLIGSTPEGDDKPYKYPRMYAGVDAIVLNKIDLLPYLEFDSGRFLRGVEALNPGLRKFLLSCRTGEGLEVWIAWLKQEVEARR